MGLKSSIMGSERTGKGGDGPGRDRDPFWGPGKFVRRLETVYASDTRAFCDFQAFYSVKMTVKC